MPLGTWGKITRAEVAPGRWRARAKYRDYDGRTRPVERYGATGAAAERALVTALRDRARPGGQGVDITPDTTLGDLATMWIAKRRAEGITPQTITNYQGTIRVHIVPALGSVRIREATVGVLDKFLRAVPGDTSATHSRIILSGMMRLAAQHDAIEHNPIPSTTIRKVARKPPRALTAAQLQALRARVVAWAGGNTLGPPRGMDIVELFDVLAGTGLRIGEALAIRWEDVVWPEGDRPGTLQVTGTISGARRQPFPKTHASARTVLLPDFAVAALRRQQAKDRPSAEGVVFPSRVGSTRTTHNVRSHIRAARRYIEAEAPGADPAEFEWVTPHVFRKTVATIIEAAVDMETAAGQLGHASPDVTRAHYVQRAAQAADVRHILDALAPAGS